MMYTSVHFIRQWTTSSLIIDLRFYSEGITEVYACKETAAIYHRLYND